MLHFFLKYKLIKYYHSVFIRYGFSISLFGPTNKLLFPFQTVISEYQNRAALHSYALEMRWRDKVVIL